MEVFGGNLEYSCPMVLFIKVIYYIYSGQDVLKAICLGAKGVWLGRAYVYGLGARGGDGVSEVLSIIRKELDVTMALCGERSVSNLGLHNLYKRSL